MSVERPAPSAAMLAFQEKFRVLQRDWQAQLPQRLQELEDRLQACRAAPADPAPITELHRLLHTLAGSAGSFGMADLGARARELEHGLDALLPKAGRTAADFDATEAGLRRLRGTTGDA